MSTPVPSALGPTRPERILFVHAHPDDETLVTGGTIATLLELGDEVTVLTATRGERGVMLAPELQAREGDGAAVAAHRERELAKALVALGSPGHIWLGGPGARREDRQERRYTDSGMRWGEDGRAAPVEDVPADALTAAPLEEVIGDVRAAIRTTRADAVIGYADDGGYGHPDHVRMHDAAAAAARAEDVPFSMIVDAVSGGPDVVIDVRSVRGKVRAALSAYRSQVSVEPVDRLAPDRLSWVMPHGERVVAPDREGFRRIDPPRRLLRSWSEYSIGERIACTAGALVLGVLGGAIGTITHQQTFGAFPLGIIITMLIVVGLIAGLRLLFGSRALVAAAGLGIVGATQTLVEVGGTSSPLVLANVAGYIWTFGPAVVAMIGLAWPELPPRVESSRSGPKGAPQL